ncbi:MAG: SURF1 family protein [Gammaproteobacteria bacterium]|nr:SURF1 family protein [Gammaproteobacteria bacterium]
MPHFSPGWKLTLFTAALAPLLLTLALWQLDREQEKIAMQRGYADRTQAAAVSVMQVDWNSLDIAYTKVSARGTFDNERTYLLDNRIYQGRVGYEVITPFAVEGSETLMVNRGWIPAGPTREQLPEIPSIFGTASLIGTIYVPLEEPFLLSQREEAFGSKWPRVVQSIRINAIAQELGVSLLPYTVRLAEGSVGLEQSNWPIVNMQPEKHRAYAVQWFVMFLALVGMYVYFGIKHPASVRNREEK